MNLKRIVSLILALMLAVNTPAALAADAHAGAADGLRRHTVTLTADTLTGKLLPLESAPSSMKDQGDYLRNAEGVVDAQIQGTYYANQKLASVSLAGTSFSFAPLTIIRSPANRPNHRNRPNPANRPCPPNLRY